MSIVVLFIALLSMFQTPVVPGPEIEWNRIIAMAVNGFLVFFITELVKKYGPTLSSGVKQLLALAAGPLLMMGLQPWLSSLLGYPVDFKPLADVLSGLVSSIAAINFYDQAKYASGAKK